MTVPYYVNENQSDIRAIKPGWYGLERNGKLSSGPFSNQGKCLTGIFRASRWLRRTIKCPECGGEHVRPCIAQMNMAAGNGLPILARPADTNSASKR
jgi:hypothetical protein